MTIQYETAQEYLEAILLRKTLYLRTLIQAIRVGNK